MLIIPGRLFLWCGVDEFIVLISVQQIQFHARDFKLCGSASYTLTPIENIMTQTEVYSSCLKEDRSIHE